MRGQLEQRLRSLRDELASGEQMLADLDRRRATLRETMLRISGAIQVLEEELGERPAAPGASADMVSARQPPV
jgi:uncharacterized coiled-coil protein SlyX